MPVSIRGRLREGQIMENTESIAETIAMFRYINPEAAIRLAAGRKNLSHSGEAAFRSGANAAITGDMLTTSGNNIMEDLKMLRYMGFEV